jgi:hypothetical protein
MATIAPVSGTLGKITWNSASLYLEKWEITPKVEIERFKHFESTADANGLYWSKVMVGFASATVKIMGKFDNTVGAFLPSTKAIWPGGAATGTLIIGGTVGYSIAGTISDVASAQGVDSPFSTYEATIELTACTFVTS